MKYFKILLYLFLCITKSFSQSHQWANNITSSTKIYPTPHHISLDSSNNIYEVIRFTDTLFLGTGFASAPPNSIAYCITKINTSGNYLWKKVIYSNSSKTGSLDIRDIKVISNNKIRVCGTFTASKIKTSLNDSTINSKYITGFVATYDSSGNSIEFLKIFEDDFLSGLGPVNTDNYGNLYITIIANSDSFNLFHNGGSIKLNVSSKKRLILVKYNSNLSSVLWYKEFYYENMNNSLKSFYINNIKTGKDNFLYLACELSDTFNFFNKTFNVKRNKIKGMYACLSPGGTPIFSSLLNEDTAQNDCIMDISARDTNFIFLLGYTKDSILNNKKWFTSSNKNSFGTSFPFICLTGVLKGVKWINLTGNKDTLKWSRGLSFGGNISLDQDNNAYGVFVQANRQISIGGLIDSNKLRDAFVKIDSLGGSLWLRPSVIITGFEADLNNNLVYNGIYQASSLYLAPFTLKSKFGSGYTGSGYIAKTYDYKIVRGDVKKGPYCSGDTILVPYTKIGVFDSSNHFVAELSDEYGNFNGNERELGRVKTNKDSMVIGRLPNFQVSTSDKYRIRIRATKPAVQGFYRPDTLRLLIYSRDKANPGPPITICRGDTVQLNTYGGSKWSWSPSYHINDSALRQPKVWPDTTTRYKIIISDSYGCGSPDTAFKTIVVRKDPKIILTSSHSKICKQTQVKITARFQWGDSSAYQNRWYFIDSAFNWVPIASNALTYSDTLLFTPPSYFNDSVRVVCILNDACSPKSDTAFYSLFIKKLAPHIRIPFNDTFVCENETLAIPFKFVNVDSMQLSYQWYYISSPSSWFPLAKGNNTLSDTIYYSAAGAIEKLVLVLNDHCNFKSDTAFVTLRLRSKTKLNVAFNDTLVCYGNTLRYKAKASGGLSASYRFMWKDVARNTMLSTTDSLTLFATQTTRIKLSITDGCIAGDSTFFTLYVNPPLKASVLWDQGGFGDTALCYAQSIKLYSHGKGGNGSGYQFKWYLGNSLVSSLDTFMLNTKTYFSNTSASKTLHLLLNDQCTKAADSIAYSITVKPTPLPDFAFGLTCNKTPIKFVFTGSVPASPVTSSYLWKFPDGDSSMLKDPSKLLTQTGIKNIRLKVSSNNGCSQVISKDIDVKLQAKAGYTAKDVCESDSAVFVNTSQQGVSYLWRFGDGNTSKLVSPKHLYIVGGQSTTFNVTLIASVPLGCSDSVVNAVTINANPSSDFDYTIVTAGKIDLSAKDVFANQYRWILSTGDTLFSSSIQISNSYANKQVCLKVTNAADCFSETCKIIFPLKNQLLEKGASLVIIPNPNNGSFNIEWPASGKPATMEIINSLGQIVYKETITSPHKSNLNLKPGVYTIQILQDKNVWMDKIVVVY
jgi:hypothetical protein